ncbi:MAG: extracellular solute-binding protein, partial [Betaproteobacteria bacterium]|nr:extracellular solute-binding protein [Betaproteobacteria bacterium]
MRARQAWVSSTGDSAPAAYCNAMSAAVKSCGAVIHGILQCAPMRRRLAVLLVTFSCAAQAQTQIHLWHSTSGEQGEVLQSLVQRFNESQKDYRVVEEHKGGYESSLIEAIKAQQAGSGPDIVQVYELGTAHLMAARGAYRPLWQVMAGAGERLDPKAYLPAVASYFSDDAGRLLGLPFNVSTPILFYNKTAFREAKQDPDKPPRTWYEMPA